MFGWVSRRAGLSGACWRRILRFRAHQGGHALLETALLFTFLPFLFLGVSEFSEADMVTRRLDEAAGKSADLIARVDSVSAGELDALKDNLIDELMKPFPTGGFGLTLTSVVTDQNGRSTVSWSHSRGGSSAARAVGIGRRASRGARRAVHQHHHGGERQPLRVDLRHNDRRYTHDDRRSLFGAKARRPGRHAALADLPKGAKSLPQLPHRLH